VDTIDRLAGEPHSFRRDCNTGVLREHVPDCRELLARVRRLSSQISISRGLCVFDPGALGNSSGFSLLHRVRRPTIDFTLMGSIFLKRTRIRVKCRFAETSFCPS
jgi:hypothetical protein